MDLNSFTHLNLSLLMSTLSCLRCVYLYMFALTSLRFIDQLTQSEFAMETSNQPDAGTLLTSDVKLLQDAAAAY